MNDPQRAVVLAHERLPDRAKIATGVPKYADYDAVVVFGRDNPGTAAADYHRDPPGMPVVTSMVDALDVDAFLVDISPTGGASDETWRSNVRTILERGRGLISSLHYFLTEDEELIRLAGGRDCDINDVCKPHGDLGVTQGKSADVDAEVALTVDIDCSVGKMTVTFEPVRAARERGIDVGFIPTGQAGTMIAGWGNSVDRVVSDFTAGAVEEMILEKGNEHDVLFVKDQGSIVHPTYSAVTCGIPHDAMAGKLVLCHEATCETIHDYKEFVLPDLPEYVLLYGNLTDPVHEVDVVIRMLSTSHVGDGVETAEVADASANELGAPVVDPVRLGSADLIDGVL